MIDIQGFHNLNEIFEGNKTIINRGQRQSDGQSVVLKVLREEYPTLEEVQRINREYEILLSLGSKPGVIKTYEISKSHNSPVLVFEDLGAESLGVWLKKDRKFSLKEILSIGAATAEALGEIDAGRVIDKDINPANILYNPEDGAVRISIFPWPRALPGESPVQPPEHLEGTLAYISPEQTGRMNRPLDYRTDYYSLGGDPARIAVRSAAICEHRSTRIGAQPHRQAARGLPRAQSRDSASGFGHRAEALVQERGAKVSQRLGYQGRPRGVPASIAHD